MAGAAHHNFVIRLYEGLLVVFDGRDDVCVLAEVTTFGPHGQPFIPDIAIIHGVGQHEPTSWRQDHGDPPITVAIEVVSPSESDEIVVKKLARFDECGVDEAWLLRISLGDIVCYRRTEGALRRVIDRRSDLLDGVHFEIAADGSIVPFFADGEEFAPHFIAILGRARRAEAQVVAVEAQVVAVEAQAAQLRQQLRAAGIEPTA